MGLGQRGRVGILNLPLRDSDSGYLLLGSPSPILGSEIPDPQQRDGGGGGSQPPDSASPQAPPLQKLPPAATQSTFSPAPPDHQPDPTLSFSPPAAWLRPP